MMTLEELVDHAALFVQQTFPIRGSIVPMWILQTEAGMVPICVPWNNPEEKRMAFEAVRALAVKERAQSYVSIVEAWALEAPDPEWKIPASVKLGGSIASHPERREVIHIMAEDKTKGRGAMFYILRPEHGPPSLSPIKKFGDAEMWGRMTGLLQDPVGQ